MNVRRLAAVLVGSVLALGAVSCTRVPKQRTVVVFNLLSHPILDASVRGIKTGLQRAGFGPERLTVRDVNANGEMDKLAAFAQEIVQSHPDIIVPVSTPVSQAVYAAAPASQRIVYSTVTNPADIGAPAGAANLTGVSDAVNYAANIDLIFELFPRTRTVGMIYNAGERNSQFGVDQVRAIAAARGFTLRLATVARTDEVADAARALLRQVDVFYVGSDNTVVSALAGLLSVARDRRIPVIASDAGSVEGGALAAVSVDYDKLGERVGAMVAELLTSGSTPNTVAPVRFLGDVLLVNRGAAQRIGYTFPDSVVQRAGRVLQ